MKKAKRILCLVLALVMVLGLTPSINVQAKAKKPKLNTTKITLEIGSTQYLYVVNATKTVKWSTSNKNVATIDSYGYVSAVGEGNCTITAKVGSKKLKCKVTVTFSDENKISAVSDWLNDYWMAMIELSYYQHDGTGLLGDIDVEYQLIKYNKVMEKFEKANTVMHSLDISTYSEYIYVWDKLKGEIQKIDDNFKATDWTACPCSNCANLDLFNQYNDGFSDLIYKNY